jgi:uroporphyrin-III C-methyltransferase
MAAQSFPPVTKGASLLLALKPEQRSVLVIGSGTTAAARVFAALEADSRVVVAGHGGLSSACPEIQWRVNNDEAEWVDLAALIKTSVDEDDPWLTRFGSFLDSIRDLFIVCVTDTMIDSNSPSRRRPRLSAELINRACRARRILVNVTDMPDLCDFIFPACHRFVGERSKKSTNLQLAITTNGRGCRIGTRVRREILARLPKDVGDAVDNVAELRALAKASPVVRDQPFATPDHDCQDEDGISIASPLNKPVPQHAPTATENQDEEINRRMRWVAQISEYWTLGRLAAMTKAEMATLLESYRNRTAEGLDGLPQHATESTQADFTPPRNSISVRSPSALSTSRHHLDVTPLQARRGQILLVGSGPGHPALLTVAAHAALTKKATLILSDKLVPSQVLALIPSSIPVQIAKKFPGNAEGAQNELMELALEGARRGETVVRVRNLFHTFIRRCSLITIRSTAKTGRSFLIWSRR